MNKSDPFAYGRTLTEQLHGCDAQGTPEQINKALVPIIAQRQATREKESRVVARRLKKYLGLSDA